MVSERQWIEPLVDALCYRVDNGDAIVIEESSVKISRLGTRMIGSSNEIEVADAKRFHSETSFPPTFIVGVPRSGTTLLVNLLGHHPLLAPIYETRFLRNLLLLCKWCCWFCGKSISRTCTKIFAEPLVKNRLARQLSRYRAKAITYNIIPQERNGLKQSYESFPFGESYCIRYTMDDLIKETDRWLEGLATRFFTCEVVWCSAREYVDRLFSIHCANMKKPYWINKTPGLLTCLDLLPRLYPGSRCIHIVRDGRDVTVSNMSLHWGPKTIGEAARRWKDLIYKGREGMRSAELSYIEVRYEDLVRSPKEVLIKVAAFLEIEDRLGEALSCVPVFKQRKEVWRSKFTLADRRTFAREAGDLLIELGYEKDYGWLEH